MNPTMKRRLGPCGRVVMVVHNQSRRPWIESLACQLVVAVGSVKYFFPNLCILNPSLYVSVQYHRGRSVGSMHVLVSSVVPHSGVVVVAAGGAVLSACWCSMTLYNPFEK